MVIAIKDIESEKSGVSLSVGVGSLHEPKEWNGLAHFLEHMLFLGSDKYKEGSEYNKYLSENGGYSNAYTSEMETNYYLEVNHKGLEGALDRFSQFFISPLMTEELTTKEMNAVHSEHSKNILNDSWR
jgi:insulysin